jgi:hypothetical protein
MRFPRITSKFRLLRVRPHIGIYYPGAPHGLTATHQDQVNADLLAFL